MSFFYGVVSRIFYFFYLKIQFGYDLGIGTYHLLTIKILTSFKEFQIY
jgi:hypothetical protein